MIANDDAIRSALDSAMEFYNDLTEENDRAAVIVGIAYIDDQLKRLLEQSFLPKANKKKEKDELLEGDSPLSTFSSRINLRYRLILIDKDLRKILRTLKDIRNGFAHKIRNCDLNVPPYSDQVKNITENLKDAPLLQYLKKSFSGNNQCSIDFRIIVLLISMVLELKFKNLPKSIKTKRPASFSMIPKNLEILGGK